MEQYKDAFSISEINPINKKMYVTELQYTKAVSEQKDDIDENMINNVTSFEDVTTKAETAEKQIRPIEDAKINCAKKLYNELSTGKVKYHEVTSYQDLLDIMSKVWL